MLGNTHRIMMSLIFANRTRLEKSWIGTGDDVMDPEVSARNVSTDSSSEK